MKKLHSFFLQTVYFNIFTNMKLVTYNDYAAKRENI
jgi:hypothetical protein